MKVILAEHICSGCEAELELKNYKVHCPQCLKEHIFTPFEITPLKQYTEQQIYTLGYGMFNQLVDVFRGSVEK